MTPAPRETGYGRASQPARTISILLVDDHTLVRESLSQTLGTMPGLKIAGTAENAQQAMDLAAQIEPDVIVMDIDMPGMVCFDAARRISALHPRAKIIFLSAFVHDRYIEQAIAVGAKGYLTKHEPREKLVEAIHAAMNGAAYFSPQVWERLVIDPEGIRLDSSTPSRASTLSIREIEVLRYLANGLTRKEIAGIMHISLKTAESHSNNIMSKLGIHNRVELTRFALREGIINL